MGSQADWQAREVLDELPARQVIDTGAYDAISTGEAVFLSAELDPTRTAAALHLSC